MARVLGESKRRWLCIGQARFRKGFMKRDVRNVYLSKVTRTIVGNIEHGTRGVKLMSNHGKQEVSVTPSEWGL